MPVPDNLFAISVRRLFGNYRGPTLQIKRSSDNQIADLYSDYLGQIERLVIPSTNQAFYKSEDIQTWIGSSSLDVLVWYDQGGNGNNFTSHSQYNYP